MDTMFVSVFAATIGSKHPWIRKSVVQDKIEKPLQKRVEDQVKHRNFKVDDKVRIMNLLKPWIFDDTDTMLGSEVKIAVSEGSIPNQKLYAVTVREIFDSKSSAKNYSTIFCYW